METETPFIVTQFTLDWWVPLTLPLAPDLDKVLRKKERDFGLNLNLTLFDGVELSSPGYYRPDSTLQEEIKAAIRKRLKIAGNTKATFFQFKGEQIPFKIGIILCRPRNAIIHIKTNKILLRMTPSDLISISVAPSAPDGQLRATIEKLAAVLSSGDIRERAGGRLQYRFYPCIHITAYEPRNLEANICDDVPWHHLASIGTRHVDINKNNTVLVPAYRSKNYSIRDDVCVIDKRSSIFVTAQEYLESRTVKDSLWLALLLSSVLESNPVTSGTAEILSLGPFLEKIRFSHSNPGLLTNSVTFRHIWPRVLDELQVIEWVDILEQALQDKRMPATPSQLLKRLEELEGKISFSPGRIQSILKLWSMDINASWNAARRLIEEIVLAIHEGTGTLSIEQLRQENLARLIEQLASKSLIPDDIRACMDLIRSYGNIGSHYGTKLYSPSPVALSMVMNCLLQIFEWYVNDFIPSLKIDCVKCGTKHPKDRRFCTECGSQLADSVKCLRCKKELAEPVKFCMHCGYEQAKGPPVLTPPAGSKGGTP